MIAITYPATHTPPSWSPERRRLDHHHDADRDREEHRSRGRDDDGALRRGGPAGPRRALPRVVVPRNEREPADGDVRRTQNDQPETHPEHARAQPLSPHEPQSVLVDERDQAADDRQRHQPGPYGLAVRAQPVG